MSTDALGTGRGDHPSEVEATPDVDYHLVITAASRGARTELGPTPWAVLEEAGPDVIVWGGSRLAGALAAADLIDEYRLLVQPLVLGRGQALFDQLPASRHLDLVETTPFPSGIVVHVYRPHHT